MKKEVYLARVIKANDGWYAIDFPDLPGTHAQCKDLMDVQQEAEDSLCSFLLAAQTVGEEVAAPSPAIELKDGEMAVIITADLDTYKKLHDTKGDCTLGELGNYVCDEVAKQAVVTNGKEQTPVVLTSSNIADKWRNIKLK